VRVFWWSGPTASYMTLYTAKLEDGPHQAVQPLPVTDIQMVILLQEDAKEISWRTADLLGWPT